MSIPRHILPAGRRAVRGQSLVVCLILLAFVTAMMGTMSMALLAEARFAGFSQQRVTAHYIARAGVAAAIYSLAADEQGVDGLSDRWHSAEAELADVEFGGGSYWVGYRSETTGKLRAGVVDEERKVNINVADRAMIRALSPAFTEPLAKAIIARRIERRFVSVEELALLEEVDEDLLKASREGAPAGLKSLLTVHGEGKINVNTAPLPVLKCVEMFTHQQAERIIEARNGEDGTAGTADDVPFTDIARVKELLEMSDEAFQKVAPWLRVSSSHFVITAVGRLDAEGPVSSTVRQVVRRDAEGLLVVRFEQER